MSAHSSNNMHSLGASSLPIEVLGHIVSALGAAAPRTGTTCAASSPRDVLAMSGVCRAWHEAFSEGSFLWKELLAQLCPGHPALSGGATVAAAAAAGGGGGGGGGACSQGLREAYKQEVLSAQLLTGRPVNHVQIPVSMLAESPEQANMPQRIRLSSVCVASGRIVALRAGRITVAAVSKNGEIIQQTLPDARTGRLAGILICDWAHPFPPDDERRNSIADSTTGDDTSTFQNPLDRGSSSSSGPGQQWPIAVAAVTNPSAVRQSSLVEVWAIESGDRQDPGRLVGKFSQDAAAIAMALAPCHARPDVILLCFAVKCTHGSRLSIRVMTLTDGVICHRHIPVSDHTVSALAWSCCPSTGKQLLVAGTTKGSVMVWGVVMAPEPLMTGSTASAAPGSNSNSKNRGANWDGLCGLKVTGPSQPEHMPRLRSIWSIRAQGPGRGGLVVVGELAGSVAWASVISTALLTPGGSVQDSKWAFLHSKVEGQGQAYMRAKHTEWIGENPAIIFADGTIQLYRPCTGRCLGTVFQPTRRGYLDRGQVTQVMGSTKSWPTALLSIAQEGTSLRILLHTPLKPRCVSYPRCAHCNQECSMDTVVNNEDEVEASNTGLQQSNGSISERGAASSSGSLTCFSDNCATGTRARREGGAPAAPHQQAEVPEQADIEIARLQYVFGCSCGYREARLGATQMLRAPESKVAVPPSPPPSGQQHAIA